MVVSVASALAHIDAVGASTAFGVSARARVCAHGPPRSIAMRWHRIRRVPFFLVGPVCLLFGHDERTPLLRRARGAKTP